MIPDPAREAQAASTSDAGPAAASTSSIYKVGTLTYAKPALTALFFWLLWGDFCYVLMEAVTPSIMPLKLKALGASDKVISFTLATIPWTMGMILNPIISFRSDRFRSRWGRRIPFIFVSLPFLVVCLIALGYGDRIGPALQKMSGSWLGQYSPQTVTIGVLTVLLVAFTFFNTFMNSVFWYLFNDVVPERLLARFMSWFRLVAQGASALYNLYIFQYAETHTAAIFTGAAILYFVGFGMLCLNVREGQYPPPPAYDQGESGLKAAVKTYAKECHTLPHYWFQFLATAIGSIGGAGVIFMTIFYHKLGLDNQRIGQLNFAVAITSAVLIVVSGWLADRIHPIRVVMIGVFTNLFVAIPVSLVWFFWHPTPAAAYWVSFAGGSSPAGNWPAIPSPETVYWINIAVAVLITAPIAALVGVWDPPLFMRLFPRSHYGQFCSANAIWRAIGSIIGSASIGFFLDFMRRVVGEDRVYFLIPFWSLVFTAPAAWMAWRLYKSWKSYGGDKDYIPPISVSGRTAGLSTDAV